MMRAALFGTYNRDHSANRIAAAAVKAAGYDLVEFHHPLWERTRDKDAAYFSPLSLMRLAVAWLAGILRLARDWRRAGGAPVAVVGFNGQLDVLLLRLLGGRYGPRIVFAPLVSLTETLVEDRGVYRSGSFMDGVLRWIDRATCRAADVVVVDTEAHRQWFESELGVERSRLLVCHLGADPDVFLAQAPSAHREHDGPLDVLWFGQYLPLHGLDVIVDAVGRLAMRTELRGRLRFTFIGTGAERLRIEGALRATRADVRFADWVAYEELAARIAEADIVLGIFGSSRKATMVIPNKVYEAAAVGAAVVTADTPAIREVFEHDRDLILCGADGLALANAIAGLATGGVALRSRLGEAARRTMLERFSAAELGRSWNVALAGPRATLRHVAGRIDSAPKLGVSVLCFQDAARTLECLHSLAGEDYPALDLLVIDNGSTVVQRRRLLQGAEGKLAAEIVSLPTNLGFSGGHNEAMRRLFERGCEYVLLLNSDTRVAPGSLAALVLAAREHPRAGPLGPRISDGRPGQKPLSLGERYTSAFLWAPRSLLRVRARRQRSYPVSGVTGAALLVPRTLYERIGGLDESLFAYYEEVDFCLRARAAGFQPMVVPAADVGHDGARGFASGMTPLSAWLKARNLFAVGKKHARGPAHGMFLLGYPALVATSAASYWLLRGRGDVAGAMISGARAGIRGESGRPPSALFAASGYAGSGESSEEVAVP